MVSYALSAPAGRFADLNISFHSMAHSHVHFDPPRGIYLISPSGQVRDPADLDRACKRLSGLGFRTRVDRAALAVHERFAGTDKQRLAGMARALRQPHPIVMATRGGYGLSRLLPFIDWQAMAESGKTPRFSFSFLISFFFV